LLEEGHAPDALEELLAEESSFLGDLLWTVCELEDVERYVEKAALHLGAADPGTAAYAFEILLRGARDGARLEQGLNLLGAAPAPVREHAVIVLASQGLARVREIFDLAGWRWAAEVVDGVRNGERKVEEMVRELVADPGEERRLVGLVLATAASEHNDGALRILEQSDLEWVCKLAKRLRGMFQHRWAGDGPTHV